MRGYFNIEIDGNLYGVLVSKSKYCNTYKKARTPFTKETTNLKDELEFAFRENPNLKEKFLNGESISL